MKFFLVTLALLPCIIMANNELWQDYEAAVKRISSLKMDNYFLKDYDFEAASKVDRSFSCSPIEFSATKPTSVHQLRPSDIQVVGAIGDSLTAANGAQAKNVIQLLNEYRGISWSIGGNSTLEEYVTVPNMIKKYNPNVKGFSIGIGNVASEGAHNNVGQPGHTSHQIYDQAKLLISRMRENPEIDFQNDWKLVTLFIGGNDVCKSCEDKYKPYYTADYYISNVRRTLDYLKSNLPKTMVNLVLALDVTPISEFESTNFFCKMLTTAFCRCGLDNELKDDALKMTREIQSRTEALVASGRFDTKDDFTVVLQPFMKVNTPPRTEDGEVDFSYFAPDCFHFSQKGHATIAYELWNNMFQEVGQKSITWSQTSNQPLKCPTNSSPFIYTSKNSK